MAMSMAFAQAMIENSIEVLTQEEIK
jgi:hypothetical protein